MTRKEAVALLERYSNYDGMGIPNLAGCKEAMKVAVDALKEAFPELAESEDERIRKGLVKLLTVAGEAYVVNSTGIKKDSYLAYLEKQKEQKPAEWSEEDKENLEKVIWYIEKGCKLIFQKPDKLISWLKSLRPQYHGDVTMTEAYKMGLEAGKASSWQPSEFGCCRTTNCNGIVQKEQKPLHWRRIEDATTQRTDDGCCVTSEKMLVKGWINDEDYRIVDENTMVNRDMLCIPVRELNAEQKEQKHILKFKIGDKVHLEGDDVNILTITGIEKDRYLTDNAYGPILFGAEDIWQIVEQKPAEVDESTKRLNVDIREEIKKLDFMGSNDARDILHVAEHFYELGLKAK